MIGNDVVDLNLAFQTNWRRKGYLQKLFNPSEQEIILNSPEPDEDLWMFWAMKEATYKAHQRRFHLPRCYNPIKFSCRIQKRSRIAVYGNVSVGEFLYYTKTSVKADHLHCISSALRKWNITKQVLTGKENITSVFLKNYCELKNFPKNKIRIIKDRNFIPHLSLENQILEESFSLSHHGRFSAYALR